MFDIGWTELIVVAIVAILVVGPKDLPGMLRGFGKTMGNLRRMARDFQRQFDDALKEAELDEIAKTASKPLERLDDARKSAQDFQDQARKIMNDPTELAKAGEPQENATKAPDTETTASTNGSAAPKPAKAKSKTQAKSTSRTQAASRARKPAKAKSPTSAGKSGTKSAARKPTGEKA